MYKKLINIIKNRFSAKKLKQEFNNNPELRKLYFTFKGHPEAKWIIGKDDAMMLYKLVKKHDFKNVLDLGTGIGASTAVIALALGGGGKITTVEQYEKCVRIAKELTPADLKTKINFVQADTYAFKNDKISKYIYLSGYKNLPIQFAPFDLVVIDGPGAWLEDGKLVSLPNGDIINLLPYLTAGCKIYIDGRKKNTELYKRFLSLYMRFLEQIGHNAVFERTNKRLQSPSELESLDIKLVDRSQSGYFRND